MPANERLFLTQLSEAEASRQPQTHFNATFNHWVSSSANAADVADLLWQELCIALPWRLRLIPPAEHLLPLARQLIAKTPPGGVREFWLHAYIARRPHE